MKNLEYVEMVNPRDGYLVSRVMENQHAATLCQWNGLRDLKKFGLSLAQNFVWNEATLFSSIPEGVDLEIDRRAPLAAKTVLMNILNSKKFRSITIILADKSRRCDFIVCKTFSEDVCSIKPTLGCPTTLILPANEKLDAQIIDILGAYFTIRDPQGSAANGLIDAAQTRDFEYYGHFDSDYEEDDYNADPNWEDHWIYEPNGPRIYDSDSDE